MRIERTLSISNWLRNSLKNPMEFYCFSLILFLPKRMIKCPKRSFRYPEGWPARLKMLILFDVRLSMSITTQGAGALAKPVLHVKTAGTQNWKQFWSKRYYQARRTKENSKCLLKVSRQMVNGSQFCLHFSWFSFRRLFRERQSGQHNFHLLSLLYINPIN